MRTTTIDIAGKERVLCFSTFVVKACTDRYGDVSKIDEALTNERVGEVLEETLWILSQMMVAGAKYCDCPACAAVEAILSKKEELLG